MATMSIMGRNYEIVSRRIPTEDVVFDMKNPRFIESINGLLDEEKIMDIFFNDPVTSDLLNNVMSMGGVVRPPKVKKLGDKYVVRDGNRRTFCYKQLHEDFPDEIAWQTVPVDILPDDMPEEVIQVWLSIIHSTNLSEKQWHPFCKAAQMVRWRRDYNRSLDEIEEMFGIPPSEYEIKEITHDICSLYMDQTGTTDPCWSQWHEAIKPSAKRISDIITEDSHKRSLVFKAMENGKLGNNHSSSKLKKVIGNNAALEVMCRDGIEEAVSRVVKGRKKTDAFFNVAEKVTTSMKKRAGRRELLERLKADDAEDRKVLSEMASEFWKLLKESEQESILTELMSNE